MAEELPPPPSSRELRKLAPEIHVVPGGARLWRAYLRSAPHGTTWSAFRRFGPTGARFDHHPPPPAVHRTRGILYAAEGGVTCLAELFQSTRTIDRSDRDPHLASFVLDGPLHLLDLTGAWITRAGGNMAIGSGSRALGREWSRRIYEAYPDLHGIRYCSSMDGNRPAIALYERARHAFPSRPLLDLPLAHPGLLAVVSAAARRLGYRVT